MTSFDLQDKRAAAAHVILFLAGEQARGRTVRMDEIAERIGVRRADVRTIVSRLHEEGHVDALRLRLTMSGLAIAASLRGCKLRELREDVARSQMNVA
jgi:Mn-dependent DtxR family transcriptional regulator